MSIKGARLQRDLPAGELPDRLHHGVAMFLLVGQAGEDVKGDGLENAG